MGIEELSPSKKTKVIMYPLFKHNRVLSSKLVGSCEKNYNMKLIKIGITLLSIQNTIYCISILKSSVDKNGFFHRGKPLR